MSVNVKSAKFVQVTNLLGVNIVNKGIDHYLTFPNCRNFSIVGINVGVWAPDGHF